jgi:hypothetical protein
MSSARYARKVPTSSTSSTSHTALSVLLSECSIHTHYRPASGSVGSLTPSIWDISTTYNDRDSWRCGLKHVNASHMGRQCILQLPGSSNSCFDKKEKTGDFQNTEKAVILRTGHVAKVY